MGDYTAQMQYCEDKKDANYDNSKKKKPSDLGPSELCSIGKLSQKIEKRKIKHIPDGKSGKIMALSWGPAAGDSRMAICDQEGALFVWETQRTTPIRLYGCLAPFTQSVALSPDKTSPTVLTGGMHNATDLYRKDANEGVLKKVKTWVAHDGYISSLAFLDASKYISSSGDAEIRCFDINGTDKGGYMTLRGHEKDAQSIKFPRDDPSKNSFITCSSDRTVKMWDLRSAQCTHSFECDSELNACAVFPNGSLIAAGGEKDKTYLFDVRAYRLLNKYARNNMKTASLEFSKSGRELYVGHEDGAIIVWDIFRSNGDNKSYESKTEAHTVYDDQKKIDTSKSRVQILDVGPAGFLASGGFDGRVKIWGAPADA